MWNVRERGEVEAAGGAALIDLWMMQGAMPQGP